MTLEKVKKTLAQQVPGLGEKLTIAEKYSKDHPIGPVTLPKLVALYIMGSLFGIVMEGTFCFFFHGGWETHVVSMFLPLCVLYGFGAAIFYAGNVALQCKSFILRIIVFGIMGSFIELVAGWILDNGMHMYAWDYSQQIPNYHGYISLGMTFAWGLIGTTFYFILPRFEHTFRFLKGHAWHAVSVVLAIFLMADLVFTMRCIARWSERIVYSAPPSSKMEQMIDEKFPDDFMANRFVEWKFRK